MQSTKIIVLGCGRVGATLVRDLSADPRIQAISADVDERQFANLSNRQAIQTRLVDLSRPDRVAAAIADCDVVVGALPSRFGFNTLKTVIEARKPYCDISFMPEDAVALNELALASDVPAVVDCGVAPGLANMILGRCKRDHGQIETAVIYVGGLPKIRRWPFQYKAPFAPADVIEEYTRPARLVEDGRLVCKPPLSDAELIDFPGIGTLEAAITDGLRSLLHTIPARNLREKTLRWPGHYELMRAFRETGLFNTAPIEIDGHPVRPLDVTSKLLFPLWKHEPDEPEFTLLRVVAETPLVAEREPGAKAAAPADSTRGIARHTYDLYDEYDPVRRETSMARTTAFPAAIVARMLAFGEWTEPGVHPPERLAMKPGVFEHVTDALAARNVKIEYRRESLPNEMGGAVT